MTITAYYLTLAWNFWCLPFGVVPYGDPYLAGAALFSLCFYAMWRKAFSPSTAF